MRDELRGFLVRACFFVFLQHALRLRDERLPSQGFDMLLEAELRELAGGWLIFLEQGTLLLKLRDLQVAVDKGHAQLFRLVGDLKLEGSLLPHHGGVAICQRIYVFRVNDIRCH